MLHISWVCTHYTSLRRPIHDLFAAILQASSCFRYATIVSRQDEHFARRVVEIQKVLVQIWRARIRIFLRTQWMEEWSSALWRAGDNQC